MPWRVALAQPPGELPDLARRDRTLGRKRVESVEHLTPLVRLVARVGRSPSDDRETGDFFLPIPRADHLDQRGHVCNGTDLLEFALNGPKSGGLEKGQMPDEYSLRLILLEHSSD